MKKEGGGGKKGKAQRGKIKREAVNGKQIGRLGRTNRIICASFRFSEQTSPSTRFPVDPSKLVETESARVISSTRGFMAETHDCHAPFSLHLFSPCLPFSRDFAIPFSQRRTAVSLRATFSNLGRPNFLEILAFGFSKPRLLAEGEWSNDGKF